MLPSTRTACLATATALLLSGPALGEAPPPTSPFIEREEVRLVTLDVVVEEKTDAVAGWQVCRDLRREQIEVLVGGDQVPLDVFESWCPPAAEPETRDTGADSETRVPPHERYILYFDLEQLTLNGLGSALKAAQTWADAARRSAEVMIVTAGRGLRIVRPMRPVDPRLHQELQAVVEEFRAAERWAEGEHLRIMELSRKKDSTLADAYADIDDSNTRRSLEILRNFMTLFEADDGTKNLIFFADSIRLLPGEEYPGVDAHLNDVGDALRRVTVASDQRNVRFYPVRQGVERRADNALTMMATDTGGRYIERTNRLDVAFERVADDLSCFYTVGFRVQPRSSGRVETLIVRIRGREGSFRTRHRKTLADPTREERETDALEAAFLFPAGSRSFPISIQAYELLGDGDRSRIRLQIQVPFAELLPLAVPGPGAGSLQTRVQMGGQIVPVRARTADPHPLDEQNVWADVATDRMPLSFARQATLTVPRSAAGKQGSNSVVQIVDLEAPAGAYRIVGVVEDQVARTVSTAVLDFATGAGGVALGPIVIAGDDPHAIVLVDIPPRSEDRRSTTQEPALSTSPLPRGSLVIERDVVASGRKAHFLYSVCANPPARKRRGKDGPDEPGLAGWRVRRSISCANSPEPISLPLRQVPDSRRAGRCVPMLDTLDADVLRPGGCRFEVALDRPGVPAQTRALDFQVAREEAPHP